MLVKLLAHRKGFSERRGTDGARWFLKVFGLVSIYTRPCPLGLAEVLIGAQIPCIIEGEEEQVAL